MPDINPPGMLQWMKRVERDLQEFHRHRHPGLAARIAALEARVANSGRIEVVEFATSGELHLDDYPWVRTVTFCVQGGGGSGGGASATAAGEVAEGGGGAGGGYCELTLPVESLEETINITVGDGGSGSSGGGNQGGLSRVILPVGGTLCTANGGNGGDFGVATSSGATRTPGGTGGTATGGDLNIQGDYGGTGVIVNDVNIVKTGTGGGSFLAGWVSSSAPTTFGVAGQLYGGGSTGASNGFNNGAARTSHDGARGVVFVRLYG